jgi:citrate synthase
MVGVQGDGRMTAFVWGIVVGWVAHAVWVFMIRPIIREAMKNE